MTQPPPVPGEQPDVEDAVSLRDRLNDRRILAAIAGAVVVVAALGLFVVKPMVSGSSNNADEAPVVHHAVTHHPSATPSPTATAAAATPAPQLKVRDPFSPLVVPAAATASASAPATTAASAPPNIVIVQPSTSPAAPTYTLKLVAVTGPSTGSPGSAQVVLNGAPVTVAVGQNFPSGTNGPFQLTYVNAASNAKYNSAEFAYGDQAFSLAIGQTQTES